MVVMIVYVRMHEFRACIERAEELDSESLTADRLLVALVIALLALLGSFAIHIQI